MELSVREAAAMMGRSPRTVRAQLARGDLPGRKRDGRWRVQRQHLPLTEAQRQAHLAKADRVRDAVEDALAPRSVRGAGECIRSVADLDAFRLGAAVLEQLRAAEAEHDEIRQQGDHRRLDVELERSIASSAGILMF